MSPVLVNTVWLRGIRRLLRTLIGTAVVVGLGVTWRAAWHGDILRATVGSGATLAMLAAGVMWGAVLRTGLATVRTRRRLGRLERLLNLVATVNAGSEDRLKVLADNLDRDRADAADRREELVTQLERDRRRVAQRQESLLARVETFSKLHDEQSDRLERRLTALESAVRRGLAAPDTHTLDDHDWAVEDAPPGERTVTAYEHLVGQGPPEDGAQTADESRERRAMRQEFAGLIHRRDYAAALSKGDEIAHRFPGSTAATDFRRVRPHLVRRIELADRAERATRRSAK